MTEKVLKGQRTAGWGIIVVGILHTLAHVIITQPREALLEMLKKGMLSVLGPDWAAVNFSVCMSLGLGFAIILGGILIVQMAQRGWKMPFASAIALMFLFTFICYAAPNGGGWLALPSSIYLLVKAWPKKGVSPA
jgi:hypothetical protein